MEGGRAGQCQGCCAQVCVLTFMQLKDSGLVVATGS